MAILRAGSAFVGLVSIAGALLATASCSSDGIAHSACLDASVLSFDPPLTEDGVYRVTIERDGQTSACTATIEDGEAGSERCDDRSIRVILGGQNRTEVGTGAHVDGLHAIDAVEWEGRSTSAMVTLERNDAVLRAEKVTLLPASRPSQCSSDSDGHNMVGTLQHR